MKRGNINRFIALILALTLTASMAVSAGAADEVELLEDEVKITGENITIANNAGTLAMNVKNAVLTAQFDKTDTNFTYNCKWTSSNESMLKVEKIVDPDNAPVDSPNGEKATLEPVGKGTVAVTVKVTKTPVPVPDPAPNPDPNPNQPPAGGDGNNEGINTREGEEVLEATVAITVEYAQTTEIKFNYTNNVVLAVGATHDLSVSTTPELSYIAPLIWSSDDPNVATVDQSGKVTALIPGSTTIHAKAGDNSGKEATCTVQVSGIVITLVSTDKTEEVKAISVPENAVRQLGYEGYGDAKDVINSTAKSVRWSSREPMYATVDSNGKITGKMIGKTVIDLSISSDGKTYTATCDVSVIINEDSVVQGTVNAGGHFGFSSILSGEKNSLERTCVAMTGEGKKLSHINNLRVDTDDGILYYNYVPTESSGVGVAPKDIYYVSPAQGGRSINDLSFVPKPECSGVVNITYTGYNDKGESYNGTIRLTVSGIAGVGYTTDVGREVKFDAADFSKVCSETTGRGLEYLSFELPAATRGILQYNYGALGQYSEPVEAGKNYYYSKDPRISSVSFIPAEGFVGSARIKYNAVNTAGSRYSGYVTIQVFDNSTTAGDINYTSPGGQPVKMVAGDFDDLCRQAVQGDLDYVRFKLPDSSKGVLRYTNEKNTSFSTTVNEYTRYYLTSPSSGSGIRPVIGNVSFVPAADFTGTAYMSFTGYSTNGKSFTGTIRVLKEETSGDMIINYSSTYGTAVTFNAADFNERCLELYGEALNYVTFELPDSSLGTLYSYYYPNSGTGSQASAATKFYRSSSDGTALSNVTFVPKRGYSGDVNIVFTGETVPATGATSGEKIGGTVRISVTGNQERVIYYNVVKGGVVNFNAADFNSVCLTYTGQNLNYVRFTESPAYNRGSLGYDYNWDNERFAGSVGTWGNYYRTAQTGYYNNQVIDKVGYKAPDNYTGTLSLEYSGYSTSNVMFKGVMQIRIRDAVADPIVYSCGAEPLNMKGDDFRNACKNLMNRELSQISFTSLPSGDTTGRLYYSYSNPAQRGSEVTTGSTYNASGVPGIDSFTFVPKANASGRAILSYSATDVKGKSFTGSVYIDIANRGANNKFNDMGNYGWAQPSVSFLTNFNIVTGQTNYQYGPQNPIKRGDFVLLLCRAFRLNTGTRPGFSDVPADSYYAWAIATASDLGIAQGDGGRFRPEDTLTREDAMVLVQRTMRAAGMSAPDGSEEYLRQFADGGSVSGYAKGGVAMMIQMGLVTGSNNLINPHSSISRAEMAVLVHRVLTK